MAVLRPSTKYFAAFLIAHALSASAISPPPVYADQPQTGLTELSVEELMNVEVTSVSKKMEKLSEAAAAIFVITQEDIRRSGATSIPEVLRMAPGLEVARIDANKWAVSARGFNSRFANKLLVLIDGRSVYTPIDSGVYWDVQDTMLEDIERIEVVRGPGSTLWGANAVNGVINIITKKANDTQGGLVSAGGGTFEKEFGAVRYGGKIGDDSYLRVYTKYFNRDAFVDSSGNKAADDWWMARSGFRADVNPYGNNSFTLQGDIYSGRAGQTATLATLDPPYSQTVNANADVKGGNILGRWNHSFADTSQMSLQLYYDRTERTEPIGGEIRDTFDTDFQHWFQWGRHHIIWGLGYRFTQDKIQNTFSMTCDPGRKRDDLYSAFLQDDITLVPDRLRFILGSKLEHNDYTGYEVQPNARLLWTPNKQQTVWAAISRAVRTPSRAENSAVVNQQALPGPPVTLVTFYGNKDLVSEKVTAYEAGVKNKLTDRLYADIASFYNEYQNIGIWIAGTPFLDGSHVVVPYTVQNIVKGRSYGAETALDWRATDWWNLRLAYTYLQIKLDTDGLDGISNADAGKNPRHQVSLRSNTNVARNVELDFWFRYVSKLSDTESYTTMDVRLGWKPIKKLELSIVGQNLFEDHHQEFGAFEALGVRTTEVKRSVYTKVSWQF